METVTVRFSNIQSHENTTFTLKPGLNFILANDNNVGKSTIFKMFTAIAKAPNNTSAKLRALLRIGCSTAYAAFDFNDERVVAWIRQDERQAPKMFFEYLTSDGETLRSLSCPQVLLTALGIVVDENGVLINFNDADSVQLISKCSVEADNILTSVILDADVELIKANLVQFSKDIDADVRSLSIKRDDSKDALDRLSFNPSVEDFFSNYKLLQCLCRLCDDAPPIDKIMGEAIDASNHVLLSGVFRLLSALGHVKDLPIEEIAGRENLSLIMLLLSKLEPANRLQQVARFKDTPQPSALKAVMAVLPKIGSASRTCWKVVDTGVAIARCDEQISDIRQILRKQTQVVQCPVKGEVFFSDEECISTGS